MSVPNRSEMTSEFWIQIQISNLKMHCSSAVNWNRQVIQGQVNCIKEAFLLIWHAYKMLLVWMAIKALRFELKSNP